MSKGQYTRKKGSMDYLIDNQQHTIYMKTQKAFTRRLEQNEPWNVMEKTKSMKSNLKYLVQKNCLDDSNNSKNQIYFYQRHKDKDVKKKCLSLTNQLQRRSIYMELKSNEDHSNMYN